MISYRLYMIQLIPTSSYLSKYLLKDLLQSQTNGFCPECRSKCLVKCSLLLNTSKQTKHLFLRIFAVIFVICRQFWFGLDRSKICIVYVWLYVYKNKYSYRYLNMDKFIVKVIGLWLKLNSISSEKWKRKVGSDCAIVSASRVA
jgi:hypothetical protein